MPEATEPAGGLAVGAWVNSLTQRACQAPRKSPLLLQLCSLDLLSSISLSLGHLTFKMRVRTSTFLLYFHGKRHSWKPVAQDLKHSDTGLKDINFLRAGFSWPDRDDMLHLEFISLHY